MVIQIMPPWFSFLVRRPINFVKKMNRSRSVVLLIAASVTVVAGCHAPDDVADCAALAAFAAGIVYGRDQQQLPW